MSKNKGLLEYEQSKRKINEEKILLAIKDLENESIKLTMQNIANKIGMSRVNLYLYKSFIDECIYKLRINDGLYHYIENKKELRKIQIKRAVDMLLKDSKKITMKSIAQLVGITRESLYVYKDYIDELKKR